VFQVEDGAFANGGHFDWPGLVLTGVTGHGEYDDDEHQDTDGHECIAVRLVEVEHLL